MKTTHFIGIISMFIIFGLMPHLLKANHFSKTQCTHLKYTVAGGGLVVIAEGLTSVPIVYQFTAKRRSKSTPLRATIMAADGRIFYQANIETLTVDFSKLSLPTGGYTLSIELEGVLRISSFNIF